MYAYCNVLIAVVCSHINCMKFAIVVIYYRERVQIITHRRVSTASNITYVPWKCFVLPANVSENVTLKKLHVNSIKKKFRFLQHRYAFYVTLAYLKMIHPFRKNKNKNKHVHAAHRRGRKVLLFSRDHALGASPPEHNGAKGPRSNIKWKIRVI